jgi:hypothetical protein
MIAAGEVPDVTFDCIMSDPLPPPSPYAHVFRPQVPETPWPKLDPIEVLSKLHAKYWGEDIHKDERRWLEMQTGGQLTPTDASEVAPGCFALNLDIDFLYPSSLWVREDYIRLYDYCSVYCDKAQNSRNRRAPSIVITGQPGIGRYRCYVTPIKPFVLKHPFLKRKKPLDFLCCSQTPW